MARWSEVEEQAPELAAAARQRYEAHVHHTLATLRRDGSPRISGTEVRWRGPDLTLASMGGSRKSADLQRDGRFALHSASVDPPAWAGDARIAGRAVEVTDPAALAAFTAGLEQAPPGPFELFTADVTEVVVVGVDEARGVLVVEAWHEGRGLSRVERT
jgi:hypothetical protein